MGGDPASERLKKSCKILDMKRQFQLLKDISIKMQVYELKYIALWLGRSNKVLTKDWWLNRSFSSQLEVRSIKMKGKMRFANF